MPLMLNDLIKNPNVELGVKKLVSVKPAYKYDGDNKTNIVEGYNYEVFLPDKGHNKFNVKIKNTTKLLEVADGDEIEVDFTDFKLFIWNNEIRGHATGISAVPQTTTKSIKIPSQS